MISADLMLRFVRRRLGVWQAFATAIPSESPIEWASRRKLAHHAAAIARWRHVSLGTKSAHAIHAAARSRRCLKWAGAVGTWDPSATGGTFTFPGRPVPR